jgi:hypothetical protein
MRAAEKHTHFESTLKVPCESLSIVVAPMRIQQPRETTACSRWDGQTTCLFKTKMKTLSHIITLQLCHAEGTERY